MKSLALGALVMILACGGFLVYLVGVAREDAHIRAAYRETRCTVLRASAHFTEAAESDRVRPTGTWWTAFTVRYGTPDGEVTSVARYTLVTAADGVHDAPRIAPGFPIGSEVPCWFDPDATKNVVLQRPDYRTLVLPLIPLVGVLVGIVALRQAFRE